MTCQGQPQLLHLSSPGCLPEPWPWIWPVASVALPLSSGRHKPATAPAHPDARAQPCVDCAVPLGVLSALFPSHLRQEPRCFSFEGASWRGAEFPHPFCSRNAASSAPSRVRVIGSRQNTMRVHPSLPSTFLHGFALQYRTCDTNCTGALFNNAVLPVLPQNCHVFCSQLLRRGQAAQERYPHVHETGDRVALERLRALLRACS